MEYTLEKLEVYQLAELFGDEFWSLVEKWDNFKKDTIGKQLVRAADSISANIAEGYDGIIIKKANSFIFTQEGQYRKPNPGFQSVKDGILLMPINAMNCLPRLKKFLPC